MAPITEPMASNLPHDDVDDLFDYNVNMQDIFRDADVEMELPERPQAIESKTNNDVRGLGIDEEVKVTKKRQPVPKLDEARLLCQAGIPKLRRIAKGKFKFKGKGHEFSDLARMLNVYQLWLDDLYPRAKFADGLTMIEKLGHKKRIQIMRREWIDEGKPRQRHGVENTSHGAQGTTEKSKEPGQEKSVTDQGHPLDVSSMNLRSIPVDDAAGSMTQGEQPTRLRRGSQDTGEDSLFLSQNGDNDQPSEDEMDALLAEPSPNNLHMPTNRDEAAHKQTNTGQNLNDGLEDDMEAMAEMGIWGYGD
ncbi:MAG: hypothetical protein Q9220_000956 [cf. Caloplaca sp. 1 TL-2023]